jgi:hypothetical protein
LGKNIEEKKRMTFILFAQKKDPKFFKRRRMELPSNSHFYHHLEAPLAFALLMKLCVSQCC